MIIQYWLKFYAPMRNDKIHPAQAKHKANAKHVLMIECLGLMKGTEFEIWADGEDAEEAVRCLAKLIINGFGE